MADVKRIEALASLLANSGRVGQVRAALELVDVGGPQAEQALLSALSNGDEHSRATTVMALAKLKSQAAVGRLEQMLKGNAFGFGKDSSAEVRQSCAFALGELANRKSVKALEIAAGRDEDTMVRAECESTLERLGAPVR
ncbi:HEAT repeat domain-containing protein [Gloeobacter violaceus]|uniref:Glr2553 protein n=1 Tax=Gloeobacter violaceus (strain ATCC 29082 / PCC 7421) TaxID=251221 RepID=Q7NHI3_GLOVI|nr:HEAT repeat domain-containing protein [Gloeobacter violaceus]BAC90494.1 glr2553 [Gloeobacter violaceus PCC 7421]